jgi:hypothetical protein
MKTFSVLLLSALLAVGLVGGAIAQSTTPPAPGGTTSPADKPTDTKNDPAPAAPSAQRDQPPATAPSADVKVDVKTDRSSESPSALPRTDESRRILGMNPTALVLIGAVLFVVVIVAIVSMTRNARDTHIDLERRV